MFWIVTLILLGAVGLAWLELRSIGTNLGILWQQLEEGEPQPDPWESPDRELQGHGC